MLTSLSDGVFSWYFKGNSNSIQLLPYLPGPYIRLNFNSSTVDAPGFHGQFSVMALYTPLSLKKNNTYQKTKTNKQEQHNSFYPPLTREFIMGQWI